MFHYIQGLLAVLIIAASTLSHSPLLIAEDNAAKVDEVVTWWEKYGKHWEDVKDEEDKKSASEDNG